MPWVKLSDDWYDDPDIIRAGADGGWLWVVALSWSARNLTDGRVPATLLTRLVDLPDVPALVDRLVGLGLVEVKGEDVVVANYHKYQPSPAPESATRFASGAFPGWRAFGWCSAATTTSTMISSATAGRSSTVRPVGVLGTRCAPTTGAESDCGSHQKR